MKSKLKKIASCSRFPAPLHPGTAGAFAGPPGGGF